MDAVKENKLLEVMHNMMRSPMETKRRVRIKQLSEENGVFVFVLVSCSSLSWRRHGALLEVAYLTVCCATQPFHQCVILT